MVVVDQHQPTAVPADPPPNGGLSAWLHVGGGFMLFFNTWGILNTFGVFQTYYESGALFTASSSTISWIGAIQAFLLLLVGFLVGPIYDRGHLKLLLAVGSFGVVFGHMMLSICWEYWQVMLAQGLCIGIGAGCLFVPCISILPTYFTTRLGLAIGLASAGSSVGGVIYPIVLNQLLIRVGFAWSVRALGFIALGTLLVPLAIMRMRGPPPKLRAFIDWSAFIDPQFMFFVVATLIGFIGMGTLLFYLSFYAEDTHTTDSRMAFYIVSIFNAASCLGRVVPNALSDVLGPFNIMAPCAVITGILALCMIPARGSEPSLIVLALLAGFFSGVFVSLPAVCFVPLTRDKKMLGTRIGMGCSMMAFGLLAGGPGAGAVLGTTEPLRWTWLWTFCGVTALASGFMYTALRIYRSGLIFLVKV
jgi:MFS family permease